MGKKKKAEERGDEEKEKKEGYNLLGKPKFKKLENGRFKCVETGHELPNALAKSAYIHTKHCRIGLIDSALARNKPPLNMFVQHPQSRLKLICQLTGDTINKSEEHIWKHINGKRFLNMLEKKEAEKESEMEIVKEDWQIQKSKPKVDVLKEKKQKKKKKMEKVDVGKATPEKNLLDKECDSEKDDSFWVPPVGERWDMDDGGDRWGSGSELDSDAELEPVDEVANGADDAIDEIKDDAGELSRRTKRMSIEIGPSSFASRKKKKKTESN